MSRSKAPVTKPIDREAIAAREAAIRGLGDEIRRALDSVAMEHAREAVQWTELHRPDVTLGVAPDIVLVPAHDSISLVELEDSGWAGNAVRLAEGPFGVLWWCDPEGRDVASHECLLWSAKGDGAESIRTVRIRYRREASIQH